MLVCSCHAVFESAVELAIANGATSVAAIGDRCKAGTDCGTCVATIEEMLEECAVSIVSHKDEPNAA